ncbi:eukaryotic translation initiation factor 2-alpha kinase [Strigomonas culicis]|nr:eukaryotic translation initiation factor 2-alpha kinase [Strigomonas culicis]|eukprot:EPY23684.1 eukaryotic translation initiation factor 2-alpha kinase [Strigomonas culicis]
MSSPTSEVSLQALRTNLTGKCGTVLYCAPEQEQCRQYDLKVDEFSIGMIALEMWLLIAGKGFHDRRVIMEEVWKTGKLPQWFCQLNPSMAKVIAQLVDIDPQRRKTCKEVLATAELPGDPIEITQTLEAVDKYGEFLAGRIVQHIQKWYTLNCKPLSSLCDAAHAAASTPVTDVIEAMQFLGVLHGSIPIDVSNFQIPMNESLNELGVNAIVDSSGKCFGSFDFPHWSTATFVGMQNTMPDENYYLLYNTKSPFVVFFSPLPKNSVFNEQLLEPLLALYHLLSLIDLTERVELFISHAQWLNAVFPIEIGDRSPPAELTSQKHRITVVDQIASAISEIANTVAQYANYTTSFELIDFMRRYVTFAFDSLQFFNTLSTFVSIVLDPALMPAQTLVQRAMLRNGLIFECRRVPSAPKPASKSKPAPMHIAFGCYLDDFVQNLTLSNLSASAFCVNVDVNGFAALGERMKPVVKSDVWMNGVAIRRFEQHSHASLLHVVEAAVTLWKGNIRACIRVDYNYPTMAKALKGKRIRWVLADAKYLIEVSNHLNKGAVKKEIALDNLCTTVRKLGGEDFSIPALLNNTAVFFLSRVQNDSIRDDALRAYGTIMKSLPATLLISEAPIEDIRSSIYALEDSILEKSKTTALQPLEEWVLSQIENHSIIPVYSAESKLLVFFVNYRQVQPPRKASRNNKNSGKKK